MSKSHTIAIFIGWIVQILFSLYFALKRLIPEMEKHRERASTDSVTDLVTVEAHPRKKELTHSSKFAPVLCGDFQKRSTFVMFNAKEHFY